MKKLIEIIKKLRSPEGCPWDRKQTHKSLSQYTLEEAWEVIDEIEHDRIGDSLKAELGDLLFQVVLHAEIASEDGRFDFQDVVDSISEKMIRRHPHVFKTNDHALSDQELTRQWQQLKADEKPTGTIWDSYLPAAPSLMNALSISKKAAGMGFDWETAWDVLSKVEEELEEIREEMKGNHVEAIEEEIGDLLFTVTNLARFYKINPEMALKRGNDKFMKRFESVEKEIKQAKQKGATLSLEEMERYWQQTKTT